jgi:Fic family protein
MVNAATAALARLDGAARLIPNPALLRRPALRREAQSTSALEGTYAPFADVLAADQDDTEHLSAELRFETLHPFSDGNGRIGRLLVIVQLLRGAIIREPLLMVSPWFEQQRDRYQDALLQLSIDGD